jgi:site-specific recombinase XerD
VPSPPDKPERPLHVKLVRGRWYWDPPDRLRKSHNLKTKALGADRSAAWAFARTLNRDHLQLGPDAPVVGSVKWMFEAFLGSDRFEGLAASTQKDYRWITRKVLSPLALGNRELGSYPAMAIRPRHADSIYSLVKEDIGHPAAHYACRVARRIWHWAARREIVDAVVNPWAGMELRGIAQRKQRWTNEQIEAVRTKAKELDRDSIALAVSIAYWFGHRQADVLGLTWAALDAGAVETRKTGQTVPVDVNAYPELASEIAAERARQRLSGTPSTHVVVYEATKRPWSRHVFGHEFRRIARAAEIPDDLQFRDLRATAMTELGDAGVDIIPMSTHSGHQTTQMARRYSRRTTEQFRNAAEQRRGHLAMVRKRDD